MRLLKQNAAGFLVIGLEELVWMSVRLFLLHQEYTETG